MVANVRSETISTATLGSRYRIGAWVAIASIAMLFTGLSSAYMVRAASAADWQPLTMPKVLWLSTFLLLVSSGTAEAARRSLRSHMNREFVRWLSLTVVLGSAFLATQLNAWRQLARQGIFLATNPHSSFFYLLTALHGLHLVGGLIALAAVLLYAGCPNANQDRVARGHGFTEAATIYWHFLDALWIYLFVLLFVWRSV